MAIWVHNTGVDLLSNREEVIEELQEKLADALDNIGRDAASTSVNIIEKEKLVDTGTLKNSIAHAVVDHTVYVGTNVEYAPYQELGTSRGIEGKHFIKGGVEHHSSQYKDIIKSILDE